MSNIHAKCSFGSKTLFDMDFDGKAEKTSQNLRAAQAQIMVLINKHMDSSSTVGEDVDLLEEGEPADDAEPAIQMPEDSGTSKKRKSGPRGGDQRHKKAVIVEPAE